MSIDDNLVQTVGYGTESVLATAQQVRYVEARCDRAATVPVTPGPLRELDFYERKLMSAEQPTARPAAAAVGCGEATAEGEAESESSGCRGYGI